jgi:hypothetical protein
VSTFIGLLSLIAILLFILLVVLIWASPSYTPLFSSYHFVSAQIASPSSLSANPIGVKIISPASGQLVPIDSVLSVRGTSTDTSSTNCQASVIVNNIKPYKPALPTEINDYSAWDFILNSSYTSIKEGPNNKITAKLECPPNLTKWYSVNVTGVSSATANSNNTLSSPSQLISSLPSNLDGPSYAAASDTTNKSIFNASRINIVSPLSDQLIPSGSKITILGTSIDDFYSDCKVYAKKNDLPFQNATAAGLTGSRDYSVWKFTYTDENGLITPGNTNNITAKISCNENKYLSFASSNISSNTPGVDNTVISYANIAVGGINQPPVAVVHVDNQEVKEGDEIVLDGKESSDPNGDALTYSWKQTRGFLDGVEIIDPTEPIAHFKVPDDLLKDTTFEFKLAVKDNYGGVSTKTISIDALSNSAPIADAGGNIHAVRGEQVTLDGSGSHDPDPAGEIVSYLWRGGRDSSDGVGLSLQDVNQAVATFSVPFVQEDTTFDFTLKVTDDEGATEEDTAEVKVKGNSKPVADAGSIKKAEVGDQVTLDGQGSHDVDPKGQIVSYNWEQKGGSPSVGLNGANSATPSFTAPSVEEDTTFDFTLKVTDDEGATQEDVVEVEVEAPSLPPPPPSSDPDPPEEPEEDQSDEPYAPTPDKEEVEEQVKEDVGEEQNADSDLNSAESQIPKKIVETCFDGVNIDNEGQFDEECEP